MNNKIKIFCISVALIIAILVRKTPQNRNSTLKSIPVNAEINKKNMRLFYEDWLNKEEKRLWELVKEKYGVDYKTCKEFSLTIKESLPKKVYPLSQKTKNLINEIAQEFEVTGLNALGNANLRSPAGAYATTLCINEAELTSYPHSMQRYIIAHEMQHIIYQDAALKTSLHYFLEEKGIPLSPLTTDPVNKIARFIELRADIHTALHSASYAQGLVTAMKIFRAQTDESEEAHDIGHPKIALRSKVGRKILLAHQHSKNSSALVA